MEYSRQLTTIRTYLGWLLISLCWLLLIAAGCSRKDYRLWADRDAYRLTKSRQVDPLWQIPDRAVEPDPTSRLADIHDPDCGPVPTDDPSAQCYMRHPYRSKDVTYWDDRGDGGSVDSEHWLQHLPYGEDGSIQLTKQRCIDLALLHSREFQGQVESLYAQALALSENRFEFALNWFGGSDADFSASGDGLNATRNLGNSNQLGFNRNLAAGGQLAVNLANSFVWQLGGGPNANFGSGNLLFRLTQPLLRGAFQHVRTESLTQSERNLLYAVRDFARFRREFYLDIVSQYLGLLNQAQGIQIEEENLRNLQLNYEEHQELFARDLVSPIQVDQVFQEYQLGRLSVINARQSLDSSLDQFKFRLGLPARVEVEIDETILQPFQLNSPELEELRERANSLEQKMMEYLPPEKAPESFLNDSYAQLEKILEDAVEFKPLVEAELDKWLEMLEENTPTEETSTNERIEHQQQSTYATRIKKFFQELDTIIEGTRREITEAKKRLADGEQKRSDVTADDIDARIQAALEPNRASFEETSWKELQTIINQRLQDIIGTIFVSQTQVRLFAIEIQPVEIESEIAVQLAIENRLDLKNARGEVVDAFRSVEIAANQLRSDLNVTASADLRTDPNKDNPLRFDGEENNYTVGVQFDGPLNRFSERNAYRASQIAYQQQRRNFMATEDAIINEVRQDLRDLQTNKFNFQVSRQRLIAATRQVDEAQLRLRTGGQAGSDSSLTQDLLNALNGLRDAQNSVISSWVSYEISRIRLFVDLELLNLDANGKWINEQENELNRTNPNRPVDPDRAEFERIIDSESDGDRFAPGEREEIRKPQPPGQPAPPAVEPEGSQDRSGNRGEAASTSNVLSTGDDYYIPPVGSPERNLGSN